MPPGITIIAGQPNFSGQTLDALQAASKIYYKGLNPDCFAQFKASLQPVVPVITAPDGLTDGYQALIHALLEAGPVVYAVAGDPLTDEPSVALIRQAARRADVPITILAGESRLSDTLAQFELTPGLGLQILDATLAASYHYPPLEAHRPVLITILDHPDLLEPLKRGLGLIYPPQVEIQGLGLAGPVQTTLTALDDTVQQLYIPAQTTVPGLTAFLETISHLRAPSGCPWDRKQTHLSLRPYLLEETYEVLAALEANNPLELADELGDLLLQIALHAQIAADAQDFQMTDIIGYIQRKMIRRHPHVFGTVNVEGADEVVVNWEAIKAQEKVDKGQVEPPASALDGISLALPALMQSLEISKKAVKVGFEWAEVDGVLRKLIEEAQEIAEADSPAEVEGEIGDFLFTAVNLARKLNVDAETALRACNLRFMRRFRKLEELARAENLDLPTIDKPTWRRLWDRAKEAVAHLE
jgi:tetrapyrrole methylase family protein/MazG family protein